MASRNVYRRAVNKKGYRNSFQGLIEYAKRVSSFLSGNPTFPTPAITLVAFTADIADLETAMSTYSGKNTNRTSAANLAAIKAAAAIVTADLKILTDYVNSIAAGALDLIATTGMPGDKQRSPIGSLAGVQNLRQIISKSVASGHAKINWKRPTGSSLLKGYSYRVQIGTTVPGTQIEIGHVTKTSVDIDGSLVGGVPFYVTITPCAPVFQQGIRQADNIGGVESLATGSPRQIFVSPQP